LGKFYFRSVQQPACGEPGFLYGLVVIYTPSQMNPHRRMGAFRIIPLIEVDILQKKENACA